MAVGHAFHESNCQKVYFVHGYELEEINNAFQRHAKFTSWFELNSQDETGRDSFYFDIPNHLHICKQRMVNTRALNRQSRMRSHRLFHSVATAA
jgi:hypothetical protein